MNHPATPQPNSGNDRNDRHQPNGAGDRTHDLGQATAEYALVLLGAAAIALILLGWATGSGGGRIGGLLDHVIDAVAGKAK